MILRGRPIRPRVGARVITVRSIKLATVVAGRRRGEFVRVTVETRRPWRMALRRAGRPPRPGVLHLVRDGKVVAPNPIWRGTPVSELLRVAAE
jgi:hypothetical protein